MTDPLVLLEQERRMLETLEGIIKELKPFEEVRIVKDQTGRPNTFLVVRSQKIIVSGDKIVATR